MHRHALVVLAPLVLVGVAACGGDDAGSVTPTTVVSPTTVVTPADRTDRARGRRRGVPHDRRRAGAGDHRRRAGLRACARGAGLRRAARLPARGGPGHRPAHRAGTRRRGRQGGCARLAATAARLRRPRHHRPGVLHAHPHDRRGHVRAPRSTPRARRPAISTPTPPAIDSTSSPTSSTRCRPSSATTSGPGSRTCPSSGWWTPTPYVATSAARQWPFDEPPADGCIAFESDGDADSVSGVYTYMAPDAVDARRRGPTRAALHRVLTRCDRVADRLQGRPPASCADTSVSGGRGVSR